LLTPSLSARHRTRPSKIQRMLGMYQRTASAVILLLRLSTTVRGANRARSVERTASRYVRRL
jgi:hypothetical protein